jgi:hypothetical protein
VSATVTKASLMPYKHFAGAEVVAVGHRLGGWVIHSPAAVCIRSTNPGAYDSVAKME